MSNVSVFDRSTDLTAYVRTATWFNVLLAVQLAIGFVYAVAADVMIPSFQYFVVPFLWITISVMAVRYADPGSARRNPKYSVVAVGVAVGYFLLVLYLAGMAAPARFGTDGVTTGLEWQRPLGWAPIIEYSGSLVVARLVPYQVIGYLALSYLIYAAVLNISSSLTSGVIGLVPCPGCAAPVLAPLVAGAAGTSSAFVFLITYTHEIATVLFIAAVGLLLWQPTLEELREVVSVGTVAGGLAVLVAGLHLLDPALGLPRLLEHVQLGTLYDPRPLAFTVSGIAILVGVVAAATGAGSARRHLYLAGMGLMATYVLGYGAWHTVLEHGAFWPHIEAHGHHDHGVLETVGSHLLGDLQALVSKIAEITLLGLLAVLYRRQEP